MVNTSSDPGPVYIKRTTMVNTGNDGSLAARYAANVQWGWENYLNNCILVASTSDPKYQNGSPDNYPADADWATTYNITEGAVALDENGHLIGDARTALLGEFGAEIA